MNRLSLPLFLSGLCLSTALYAGEVVFYVNEEGAPVTDVAVSLNGERQLVGSNGFAVFDVDAGEHQAEFTQLGQWVGEVDFELAAEQNAEVQVELIAGEAMADVQAYVPGAEEEPALGQISGMLTSAETGGAVVGARISVADGETAVETDADGFFSLELPRGRYDLTVAHPEYGNRDIDGVQVISNVASQINLTLSMSGDGVIEEVVAVGSYIPSTATASERDASAVLDAIGSEQLAKFGDSNAAAALKRVAGVSIVDGQFAVVRGMSGRYISSTLNGFLAPSTDPTRRDVRLDMFSSSVIGGIEIQKSFTPDLPGDSTAGSISINTKGLPDSKETEFSFGLGFNSEATFEDVLTYSGANQGPSADILEFGDGDRALPGELLAATNGGEESFNTNPVLAGAITPAELERLGELLPNIYDVSTTEAGPDISIGASTGDYIEGSSFNWGYRANFSYKNEWSVQKEGIERDLFLGNGEIQINQEKEFERSRNTDEMTGYVVAGIETQDGGDITSNLLLTRKTTDTVKTSEGFDVGFDQNIESTELEYVKSEVLSYQLKGTHYPIMEKEFEVAWRAGIANSTRESPDRRMYGRQDGRFVASTLNRRWDEMEEDSYELGLDLSYPFLATNDWMATVKGGVGYLERERDSRIYQFQFRDNGDGSVNSDPSVDNIVSPENIGPVFSLQNATVPQDTYSAEWEVNSIHTAVEADYSTDMRILAGARLEDSTQTVITSPPSATTFDQTESIVLDTSDVLPVINATWFTTDKLQLRAGYSQTISRPDFTERSFASYFDPIYGYRVIGNPNLVNSEIDNIDVRAEYYFSEDESITLALFQKDITDPIERVLRPSSGSQPTVRSFENAQGAEVSGIELDFRMGVYQGDSHGMSVSGNLAFIDSEIELTEQSKIREGITGSRELQGQSPYLFNLQLGYEHYATGQELTLVYNRAGERISSVANGPEPNIMEQPFDQLDLVYQYETLENWTFKAKATNILDEEVEFTQGDMVQRRFKEGVGIDLGFNYRF